jgi:dimethylargininase
VKAIIRRPGESLGECELTHLNPSQINYLKALDQHKLYGQILSSWGLEVIELEALLEAPDGVFVEDPVLVLDELAIITRGKPLKRELERESLARVLSQYRTLFYIEPPGFLEGGDILRIGRELFVGLSSRTNKSGVDQLEEIVRPHHYNVHSVELKNCLHLKTACTYIGEETLLLNPDWLVDLGAFKRFQKIFVASEEGFAANLLYFEDENNKIKRLYPKAYPKTEDLLCSKGFSLETLDISELAKAEAGLTCMSLIFKDI